MRTRDSNKNIAHCLQCGTGYRPNNSLPSDEYPYCPLCNYRNTTTAIRVMNSKTPDIDEDKKKKKKRYRYDYVATASCHYARIT